MTPVDEAADRETSEPVEPPRVDRPPADERRMVPAAAFVAAVMVAAVLAIVAVVGLTSSGGGEDAELRDARLAAGRFAERFLSFEHDRLDDWKADVLALSTGGFASEVETVEAGLRRLIGEAEIDATTQVTDIFIGEVDRGSVAVVLVYDRTVTGETSRSETDRYVQLGMVRVDGTWLVDSVLDIATAGGLGAAPAPPESTTTTTAGG